MYKYVVYGIVFEFDIKMPECEAVDEETVSDVCVKLADMGDIYDLLEGYRINEKPNSKGELPTRYVKRGDGQITSYIVDVGVFRVTGAKTLEYYPKESTDTVDFRQWLLAYGITLILIQRHDIVLHGAGMLVPGTDNAIVVCGESGAGKSTISNALLERGLLFVADDSVRVDSKDKFSVVYGSNKQRRLCFDVVERENYDTSSLVRYEVGAVKKWIKNMGEEYYGAIPRKLTSLFVLYKKTSGLVEVEEVKGADKVSILISQLYKVSDYVGEGLDGAIFMKFANIAKNIKVYKVYRPEEGMTIDEITGKIYRIATE